MNADNFRSVLAFFARHELQRLSLVNRQIYQCIQRDFGDAPYVWLEHISYLNGEFNWAISFSSLSACRFLRSHLFSFISPPPLQIMPQIQHVWQDAELRGTFDTGAQLTAQVGQAIAKSWKLCFYSTADTLIGSALNVLHILLKGNCEQISLEDNTWTPELKLPAVTEIINFMFKPVRRKRFGREKFRLLRISTVASPTKDFCQELVQLMKKQFSASGAPSKFEFQWYCDNGVECQFTPFEISFGTNKQSLSLSIVNSVSYGSSLLLKAKTGGTL